MNAAIGQNILINLNSIVNQNDALVALESHVLSAMFIYVSQKTETVFYGFHVKI